MWANGVVMFCTLLFVAHEKKEDSISFRKKQSLSELSEIESQSVVSEPKKIKKSAMLEF